MAGASTMVRAISAGALRPSLRGSHDENCVARPHRATNSCNRQLIGPSPRLESRRLGRGLSFHRPSGGRLHRQVQAHGAPETKDVVQPRVEPGSKAMIWFKYDLRTDDHPGMVAVADAAAELVPFFCFDPKQYVQVLRSPGGPEALWGALKGLQDSLREQGSDLIIRVGKWESEVPRVAAEAGATVVVAEEEVEYRPRVTSGQVEAALVASGCEMERWALSLFDPASYEENYRDFAAKMGAALPPLSCPRLPPLPKGLKLDGGGSAISLEAIQAAAGRIQDSLLPHLRSVDDDEWAHEAALGVVQGESAGLQALEDYLRFSSASPPESSSTLPPSASSLLSGTGIKSAIAKVESPAGPGGSFRAVFSHALTLGTLSRRRVYQLAAQYEEESNSGQQSLLSGVLAAIGGDPGSEALGRAAKECAVTWDFHVNLAQIDAERGCNDTGLEPRYWRWRGMLTHYVEASPKGSPEAADGSEAPAVLLVHGFGAFGEHWRRNVQELADSGYRVFAPTYPGYGRSEKPMAAYSQNLWTDFLRDFVLHVVGEKVVVAGNSIGGFLCASMAADHPELVAGLVLLNSAGGITKGYVLPAEAPGPRNTPFWIADTISKLLIGYLEGSIGSQLTSLYPTNPAAADKYLADEIYRAACDPGALGVFRSVFYLPPPRPINFLIDTFAGPTLVLQGKLDPLNDAVGRARSLKEACKAPVEVILLEAGHCPHDEVPEVVNKHLTDFVRGLPQSYLGEGGKETPQAQQPVPQ